MNTDHRKYLPSLCLFLLLCQSCLATAQTAPPFQMDLEAWGQEYLPVFTDFDRAIHVLPDSQNAIRSSIGSASVSVTSESDLTVVPYDESHAEAVIFSGEEPVVHIAFDQYRNYLFKWINETVLHVYLSPGRCVTIDTLYDIRTRSVIYQEGFNHCGVRQ